jgi:hypothetical protein
MNGGDRCKEEGEDHRGKEKIRWSHRVYFLQLESIHTRKEEWIMKRERPGTGRAEEAWASLSSFGERFVGWLPRKLKF